MSDFYEIQKRMQSDPRLVILRQFPEFFQRPDLTVPIIIRSYSDYSDDYNLKNEAPVAGHVEKNLKKLEMLTGAPFANRVVFAISAESQYSNAITCYEIVHDGKKKIYKPYIDLALDATTSLTDVSHKGALLDNLNVNVIHDVFHCMQGPLIIGSKFDTTEYLHLQEFLGDNLSAKINGKDKVIASLKREMGSTPPDSEHPVHERRIEAVEKDEYGKPLNNIIEDIKAKGKTGKVKTLANALDKIDLRDYLER